MKPLFHILGLLSALFCQTIFAKPNNIAPLFTIPTSIEQTLEEKLKAEGYKGIIKCYGNNVSSLCLRAGMIPGQLPGLSISFD